MKFASVKLEKSVNDYFCKARYTYIQKMLMVIFAKLTLTPRSSASLNLNRKKAAVELLLGSLMLSICSTQKMIIVSIIHIRLCTYSLQMYGE